MTIFFSGHSYKYELEGITKLFFPLMRFEHIYDEINPSIKDDYIITRLKKGKTKTILWVYVKVGNIKAKDSIFISNDVTNYDEEAERLLCVILYNVLNKVTGIKPSWGIITGIRPVATIVRKRNENMTDDEIKTYLKEKFLISDEKLNLAFHTADVQRHLLKQNMDRSYSLYISIPFCLSRCSYCSFVSHSINTQKSTDKIEQYLDLLCKEIELTSKIAESLNLKLDTIYIGGGTPTALTAIQLKKITDCISMFFDVSSAREYTIEAGRADSITKEKLEVIKNAGAKRISVNPQTFNDDVLKEIGRKHTAKQAEDTFLLAKEIGFESINMDFIAGLPKDSFESFKHSIDKAIELSPENITVHTLTIKRSADLFSKEGIEEYAKSNITGKMMDYAYNKLSKEGYRPYYLYRQKNTIGNLENVGYSKEGYESLYNVYIMDEMQTILACGAGGVTKMVGENGKPIERIFNFKYHFEYITRFDEIISRKEEVIRFYEKYYKPTN